MADTGSNLIVALDFDSPEAALDLATQLDPSTVRLKVGKQLFTLAGPDMVRALQDQGFDIFLDLKFHDIPNTVAKAVRAAADLRTVEPMVNVHASEIANYQQEKDKIHDQIKQLQNMANNDDPLIH